MHFKPRIVKAFGQPIAAVEAGKPTPVIRKDAIVEGELIWVEFYVAYDQLYSILASLDSELNSYRITWWEDDEIVVSQSCPPFEAQRLMTLMKSVLVELGLQKPDSTC